MEHNKHMQDFEQDLHETAKRVSAAYKNVQPDKRLLENVLARIPELQATAVSTDHLLGAPSPYQRFFPLKKLAYIVSAALTIVLVAVASFSGTSNDPTRLAQESFVPEADRMAMMVEDAQPSLMVASEPAPEGDAANARMMVPSAKMAPATLEQKNLIEVPEVGIKFLYPDSCTPTKSNFVSNGAVVTYDLNCPDFSGPDGTIPPFVDFFTEQSAKEYQEIFEKCEEECWRYNDGLDYDRHRQILSGGLPLREYERIVTVGESKYIETQDMKTMKSYVTYIGDIRIKLSSENEEILKYFSFIPI